MYSYSETIDIKAPIERIYEILIDFKHYHKFSTSELKNIKVLSFGENRAEVNYTIGYMVITANYTLEYKFVPNKSLKWKLIEGTIVEKNSGSWEMTPINKNLTRATFKLNADFAFYVPSILVEIQLEKKIPIMLAKLAKLAEKKKE